MKKNRRKSIVAIILTLMCMTVLLTSFSKLDIANAYGNISDTYWEETTPGEYGTFPQGACRSKTDKTPIYVKNVSVYRYTQVIPSGVAGAYTNYVHGQEWPRGNRQSLNVNTAKYFSSTIYENGYRWAAPDVYQKNYSTPITFKFW